MRQQISEPAGTDFSGVIKDSPPFSSSAHKSIPSDTRPRIFLGAKLVRTMTFFPTISSGV